MPRAEQILETVTSFLKTSGWTIFWLLVLYFVIGAIINRINYKKYRIEEQAEAEKNYLALKTGKKDDHHHHHAAKHKEKGGFLTFLWHLMVIVVIIFTALIINGTGKRTHREIRHVQTIKKAETRTSSAFLICPR